MYNYMIMLFLCFALFIGFVIGEALLIIPAIYAKKKGVKGWGWIFLPTIGSAYVIGALSDQYVNKKYRILLPILTVISNIIFIPGFINYIFEYSKINPRSQPTGTFFISLGILLLCEIPSIITSIFEYIAMYRMFAFADKNRAVMWLLLSIFFGVPVFIFWLVNMNKPGISNEEYRFD